MSTAAHRRAVVLILDGVGCGALPDADRFGDAGANTLGNLASRFGGGLHLPELASLGLGKIETIRAINLNAVDATAPPAASHGHCTEVSAGKDSTTGHWEIAGVPTPDPFPTYPEGFPPEILDPFCEAIGRGVLANRTASGTEIIEELGAEHLATGMPIVYTSADSVFQIAAHESVYSIEELYRICEIARGILTGPHAVGRVIARPFAGEPGKFRRTADRRDFSLAPPGRTLLDACIEAGVATVGIGKIGDLFAHRGLSREIHTASNEEGITATIETMRETPAPALIFTNLVEFDSIYGHRNDCNGFRAALEAFDARLPEIRAAQRAEDLMIITADHGTDPTMAGTDHTREHVPLLAWGERVRGAVDLGLRETYADVGQSVADWLGCEPLAAGSSFIKQISREESAR